MQSWNYGTGFSIDSTATIDEMLNIAGLNWNVETSPVTYGTFNELQSENKKAAYRSDTGALLDIYLNRIPNQNKTMLTMFDQFLKKADLAIDTIGSTQKGANIYASALLPETFDINPKAVGDITKARLVISDSHLNGVGLSVSVHYDRLICTNGMTTKVSQEVGVIHHNGVIQAATVDKVLSYALQSVKVKRDVYDVLSDKPISIEQAITLLIASFGDSDKSVSEQPEIVQTCLRLFQSDAIGGDLLTSYHTAYGLLNSVTEYFNHHSKVKSEENRFSSLLSGSMGKVQNKFQSQLVRAFC